MEGRYDPVNAELGSLSYFQYEAIQLDLIQPERAKRELGSPCHRDVWTV